MQTPSTWTLNGRGLDWLNAEADRWFGIVAGATTAQDRADASAYLHVVIAERDQRLADYAGGFLSTVGGAMSAPFELFGGSAGPGASGLSGGVADTVSSSTSGLGNSMSKIAIIATVGLLLVGGMVLHKRGLL